MNFEKFVAKRLHSEKNMEHSISAPILKMAIAAVSLSITVMIIALSVGKGLQQKIGNKVRGFTSDIQIRPLDLNQSIESIPITLDSIYLRSLNQIPSIEKLHPEITKNSLIKTDTEFDGVLVKGFDHNYDWTFFEKHIVQGFCPIYSKSEKSQDILVSKKISQKLNLELNQEVLFYFQGKNKAKAIIRKFKICGIYETGIELFDDHYTIVDIKQLQKINRWEKNQFSSLEIGVYAGSDKDKTLDLVEIISPYEIQVISSKERYSQIFDWIQLFDINILLIIFIMVLVASINMISSLLIVILERAKMIGLLRSLGARQVSIKKIFLYHAFYLLKKGLFIGNMLGLTLIGLQHLFAPLRLDPSHYYVREVPVLLSLENWLLINLVSVLICMVILLIPAQIIKRIEPIEALRYE